MSIKKLVDDLLAYPTPRRLGEQKFTFAELQEFAERDDFGDILAAVGVLDTPIPRSTPKAPRTRIFFRLAALHSS